MRILYVDDDRINILLFQSACARITDVELRCEDDAAVAADAALAWQPDLFVLDHFLRGTTGVQLLHQMREHESLSGIRAVLCSADSDPSLQQAALSAGFVACWTKPILADTLRQGLAALAQTNTNALST
jgi:CheY-like chemotaxis protein